MTDAEFIKKLYMDLELQKVKSEMLTFMLTDVMLTLVTKGAIRRNELDKIRERTAKHMEDFTGQDLLDLL